MHTHNANHRLVLLLTLTLTILAGVGVAAAQENIHIAGKWSMTIAKQDTFAVGDAKDHYFSLSRAVGTNLSAGENKFMDGGEAVNVSLSDLVRGNGPHHGYATLTHENSSVYCRWEGRVMTTIIKDAPEISFEGTFSWTGGTGPYVDIRGTGTFKGYYTSSTTYTVEWAGGYTVAK